MSSAPSRLTSHTQLERPESEGACLERRRAIRTARLDAARAAAGALHLVDVSSFGCCVRNADRGIGPGHFVALHVAALGAINGYVRWREDESMGIEFCRELTREAERALSTIEMLEAVRRL
ncbi:MAG TPA: hypothetical protein VI199_08720 [Novosphingobium sp.]